MSCLKSLKLIDLANNSIQLLPRNMDSMSNLESLDLSKNLLKAVPCEFSEVFESVPNIELSDNPWDMLPAHWGKFYFHFIIIIFIN
jgi:Leucine-rich repeat (LRR) protein